MAVNVENFPVSCCVPKDKMLSLISCATFVQEISHSSTLTSFHKTINIPWDSKEILSFSILLSLNNGEQTTQNLLFHVLKSKYFCMICWYL